MARGTQTVPDWAIGCMDREYLVLDGGPRDPSVAIWIQTESRYIDIRIPQDRPAFPGRRSLDDFSSDELLRLAPQSGDTGICTIEDGVAHWDSEGDRFGFFCDEVAMFPDDGRLAPRRGVLLETQTEASPVAYEEAWVQQPWDHGLVANLTLREAGPAGEVLGVLLVTGRHAGFVERAACDSRRSLQAQLEFVAPDLPAMRCILDCEASYAIRPRIGEPFRIRHSNLPFREGRELEVPTLSPRRLTRRRELPSRRPGTIWRVESWFVQR
jgi:hypothetical protein